MILLSGATGKVGSAAAHALNEANVPFRILVRDPDRFKLAGSDNVDVVQGDLENEADVKAAMQGATKAFLLMGNSPSQAAIERQFSDIAAETGVGHIVKISSMEAAEDAVATLPKQHYASEQHIRTTGIKWTFLRPNYYMQNMLMYAGSIANAKMFALPLGDAQTAMVDTRDVGAVVAKVLTEAGHENKIYQLTGSDLSDFHEVAKRMSQTLDQPVKYIPQSAEEFRAVLQNFIQSEFQLNAVCELFAEIAKGSLEHKTSIVKDILGRDPISLETFTGDFAMAFKG